MFRTVFVLLTGLLVMGCASHSSQNDTPVSSADQDPFEPINRVMFKFNDTADTYVVKPIARGYRAVTPNPVENSVSRFFSNIGEIRTIANSVLQWNWSKAGNSTGRFLINSTYGLAGLFDVAKSAGLAARDSEDFGQTLAVWGVGTGPYLVLPLTGPSNLRDLTASAADYALNPIYYLEPSDETTALIALNFIDLRAGLLDAEDFVSGDKYTFFRDAYLQRRNYLIKNGEVEDDFGGDFDDFDSF